MSGKRQHVIPRFLLKGFQSKTEEKEIYSWVFPQEGIPYETNIKNIAVEKEFYSSGNDDVVDTLITKAEQSYSKIIQELRNINSTASIRDDRLPQLLAHIEVRTRHLRNSLLESGDIVLRRAIDFFNDKELIERTIKKFISDSSFISNIVQRELIELGKPKELEKMLINKIQNSYPLIIKALRPQVSLILKKIKEKLPSLISDWTKYGHLESLKKSISPEIGVNNYSQMTYELIIFDSDDLILGDNGLILGVESPRLFKTFWEKNDNVKCLYLPISSDRILVGKKSLDVSLESMQAIKEMIASCSREFFISSKKTEQNKQLQSKISIKSDIISSEEINKLMDKLIEEEIRGLSI